MTKSKQPKPNQSKTVSRHADRSITISAETTKGKRAISIQKFPDPPKQKRKRNYTSTAGRTSGLGPNEFLATVFSANEINKKKFKLTDESIRVAVVNEFRGKHRKGCKSIADRMRENPWEVNRMRGYYNRGRLTGGVIPSPLSRRYDNEGNPITEG